VAWTRDGREIVFGDTGPLGFLWRVGMDGSAPPRRIEVAGPARSPAIATGQDRLAFARSSTKRYVYRFVPGAPAIRLLTSSGWQGESTFSPDGRRVAFRTAVPGDATTWGDGQIWVSAIDGSGERPLTRPTAAVDGSPAWSPDGRHIAFDRRQPDDWRSHIWVIDAEGGVPRQLTSGDHDDNIPSWSRDGRWIYYTSGTGATRDVWRVAAGGGDPQRVTTTGSFYVAAEASDRSLVYQPQRAVQSFVVMPAGGGPAQPFLECVRWRMIAVAASGVYYVPCTGGSKGEPQLHHVDPRTRRDRVLGSLEGNVSTLSVSPDETIIAYDRTVDEGTNLWLIDDFR
jgi:Tol biopolymer transport system component